MVRVGYKKRTYLWTKLTLVIFLFSEWVHIICTPLSLHSYPALTCSYVSTINYNICIPFVLIMTMVFPSQIYLILLMFRNWATCCNRLSNIAYLFKQNEIITRYHGCSIRQDVSQSLFRKTWNHAIPNQLFCYKISTTYRWYLIILNFIKKSIMFILNLKFEWENSVSQNYQTKNNLSIFPWVS